MLDFQKCIRSIFFGQTTQEKLFVAKFGFLWKLFLVCPLKLGFSA